MRAENEREKEIKRLKRLNIIFTALYVLKKLFAFWVANWNFILLIWTAGAPAIGAMWGGGSDPEFDRATQKVFLFGLATVLLNSAICCLAFRSKKVCLDKNSDAKNWAVYSFVRGGGLSAVAFIKTLFSIFMSDNNILFALSSAETLFFSILFFAEGGLCLWAAKKQKKGDE